MERSGTRGTDENISRAPTGRPGRSRRVATLPPPLPGFVALSCRFRRSRLRLHPRLPSHRPFGSPDSPPPLPSSRPARLAQAAGQLTRGHDSRHSKHTNDTTPPQNTPSPRNAVSVPSFPPKAGDFNAEDAESAEARGEEGEGGLRLRRLTGGLARRRPEGPAEDLATLRSRC